MTHRSFVQRISDRTLLLSGWKTAFLSLFLGALSAAGQAPLHLFPLLFVTFTLLVFLLDGAVAEPGAGWLKRLMPAFWRGWWFGFGYFLAGLWWLGSAFLVNAERFALLMPLAVVVLPAFLAIFFGVATMIARLFWQAGFLRIVVLATSFGFVEWLRATILTGFPWNSLGYLLAANDVMMQALSLIGMHLYAFLAVLIFSSPAILADEAITAHGSVRRWPWVGLSAFLMIAIVVFGVVRLQGAHDMRVEGVSLRIIQPDVAQRDKFKPEKAGEILERYLSMSARSREPGDLALFSTTHLIWPESAFPFLLTEHPAVLESIGNLLPPGTTLITGAVRADPVTAPGQSRKFYNSVYTINHDGEITDAYDKVHLVPFGEYLPFQEFLEGLGLLALVETPGGFTPGPTRRTMKTPIAPPFLPLICYEIIFPGQLDAFSVGERPGWIMNVTNDAWFGITSGPYQHYHQSRLRAVAEGLPVIRAANNGISAVLDAYGREVVSAPLGEAAVLDAPLPIPVQLFVIHEHQNVIFWLLTVVFFLWAGSVKAHSSRRQA